MKKNDTPHTAFYDALGIKPTASQDDIRAGYRRAASLAHPDKNGGNSERMALVNMAYACLSVPVKRLFYDRTGQTDMKPDEERAIDGLQQILAHCIEHNLSMRHAQAMLDQNIATCEASRKQASDTYKRCLERQGKIKYKGKDRNIFEAELAKRAFTAKANVQLADIEIGILHKIKAKLAEYEDPEPKICAGPSHVYAEEVSATTYTTSRRKR